MTLLLLQLLPAQLRTDLVTFFLCIAQINWAMHDKQELIDIVEVVYRGARKGHGLVVSPKGAQQAHPASPPCMACCLKHWQTVGTTM